MAKEKKISPKKARKKAAKAIPLPPGAEGQFCLQYEQDGQLIATVMPTREHFATLERHLTEQEIPYTVTEPTV